MIEHNETELAISFTAVHEQAILRMHFCHVDAPDTKVPILGSADEFFEPATHGRFIINLRPHLPKGQRYSDPGAFPYPFALLLSVDGTNAITGDGSTTLGRTPQNYFATPPQGGIDGYFFNGRVLPFRAGQSLTRRSFLSIKVFPAKKNAIDYWKYRRSLCGSDHEGQINDLILTHGGARQCEPIYEDLCSLGDWDQSCEEEIIVGLSNPS